MAMMNCLTLILRGRICKMLDSASALVLTHLIITAINNWYGFGPVPGGLTQITVYGYFLFIIIFWCGLSITRASLLITHHRMPKQIIFPGEPVNKQRLLLGNTNLITQSVYLLLGGRVIQITQKQITGGVGSYPTYTTRFEYDANLILQRYFTGKVRMQSI